MSLFFAEIIYRRHSLLWKWNSNIRASLSLNLCILLMERHIKNVYAIVWLILLMLMVIYIYIYIYLYKDDAQFLRWGSIIHEKSCIASASSWHTRHLQQSKRHVTIINPKEKKRSVGIIHGLTTTCIGFEKEMIQPIGSKFNHVML